MANNSNQTILNPGTSVCSDPVTQSETGALLHDNFLSEFVDEREKALARTNLGVLASTDTMRTIEIENYVAQAMSDAINTHLSADDPHKILARVDKKLEGYVKTDGTVPMQAPLGGKNPVAPADLTTKEYVDNALYAHASNTDDPHKTMIKVKEELANYAPIDHVYGKSETYTQVQVDTLIKNMIRNDGTTPFLVPQQGVYPKSSLDLSTKGYVDDMISQHKLEKDPHGLVTTIEDRLSNYYTKDQVYTKDETYSRAQLNSKIEELMTPVVDSAINKHLQEDDPHHTMEAVKAMNYVKADGSVPFTNPQQGVPGIKQNDLATIGDVDYRVKQVNDTVQEQANGMIWNTSGPVQTTVGYVEDNTELPAKITFQEIMDSIFYGDGVYLEVPAYAEYNAVVDVSMNIRPITLIDVVKLYQDDVLISTFQKPDFEDDGEYSVKSNPITNNPTTFRMEVTYTNGNIKTVTAQTKIAFAVYAGIMPKWMNGSQVTINWMETSVANDPTNNNKFFTSEDVEEVTVSYNFTSPTELKSLYIALPVSYPNLVSVETATQQINVNQFECVNNIPLTLNDGRIVMYKLYILRIGMCELNMDVTYKLQK